MQNERRTGRTTRMVEGLPPAGCTIVIHTAGMRSYLRDLIERHHGRGSTARMRVVVVETVEQAMHAIQGCGREVFVDHAFYEHARRDVVDAVEEVRRAMNARFGRLNLQPRQEKTMAILMSAENPTGAKLEDLLRDVADELEAKSKRLEGDVRPAAVDVLANNREIIARLRGCLRLQEASVRRLDEIAPDPGPRGVPRVGKDSPGYRA